ncbi:phenylalanine--tRNA ligase subunit beta [Demequina sp. TTPB684]|uniref:phenylalanine--tRNA ligase subunit beta n=1 Tax=unclassified Demequina TaxID=2620311 RepID=UPI001CF2F931|nr:MULTISPECIES: phenylalanine--tRNA ligase subunit beta [unclassified Demequina]MCB2412603.1 phenylalanine--tRNA ligase subunit beta [Demequina sp. TTPB684]UPU89530.1 phenylalanine--tRNA ligase subunit beta [Demequina sp. TMPB413]
MPKIPLNWLAEYVDLVDPAPEAVAAALVKVGLEEEGIHGGAVTGPLVVGRVLSLVKEEQSNGKTINYCRVDVGEHNDPAGPGHKPDHGTDWPASRGIVCGAHNFVEGDYVVCILPGGVLPGPFPIGGRKTYGHWSDGMICSAKELGLGEDHAGIIVLASPSGASEDLGYDADALAPGQDAIALLGLDEKTIEVTITPDRGYCFSIRGIAREYSHSTGAAFRDPAALEVTGTGLDPADSAFAASSAYPVSIEDEAPIRGTAGCDRFAARVLRGFNPGAPSPAWMKRRLEQSGMRSISLAVDVTNYVMLELGHPLHAYDLATLHAPIVVRRASAGETLVTLDDVTRELSPEDLLVCDSLGGHGARPVGMGGVMGGLETEISATTTDVLLEAAHWDPITIARTARRHKLGSEASRRYERGVDTALAPVAIERALGLMKEFGGGEIEDVYTDVVDVPERTAITMDVDFPSRIVGMDFPASEVVESLRAVGCAVLEAGAELTVTPPTWRPDLDAPVTLAEEVARLRGYAEMPSVLPVAPPGRGLTHSQKVRRSVARSLADAGLTEVLTYPFMAPERLDECLVPADDKRRKLVRLANPLAGEKPVLRPRVLFTLFDAVRVNLGRGAQDVAVFEVGRGYLDTGTGVAGLPAVDGSVTDVELKELDAALPEQLRMVAGVLCGSRVPAGWNQPAAAWEWSDALALVETVAAAAGVSLTRSADSYAPWHPGRAAVFALPDGTPCAHAGELHPKVCETLGLPARSVAFQVLLDPIIAFTEGQIVAAEAVSGQVLAKEDFAFVVPDAVTAGALVAVVRSAGGDLVEDVRVFDVYAGAQVGEGLKSVAVNVRMRAADHTLTTEEVLSVRESVIAVAESELGAVLR